MSASAVRRIQSGMACSEHGAINRLSVIAQASPRRWRQLAVAQNAVEFETLPELVADMDRTGFTMALGRDARRIDLDQPSRGPCGGAGSAIIDAADPMPRARRARTRRTMSATSPSSVSSRSS